MEKFLIKEVVSPIIIILVFSLVYLAINIIIKKVIKLHCSKKTQKRKKTLMILFNNIAKYTLIIIAIVMILNVYGVNTTALLTSLGLVGLGVSLSLQDTVKDFLAGIFIIFENQYDVGDTIEVSGFKGEVIALGLKTTKIKAVTGEVNIIANRNIGSVINHSFSNSLAVVEFDVSYEQDPKKVEKVLTSFCSRMTQQLKYLKGDVTLFGITNFGASGVGYKITAPTVPMKHYEVATKIRYELQIELTKEGIEIPYDQLVIHNA